MTIDYDNLAKESRLLAEVKLKPLQGNRFQATGFADLGPARYTLPDGIEMLLVESAQSVANRMELACWDQRTDDLIDGLKGLPYIRVKENDRALTNSIFEAHRINSPYILGGQDRQIFDALQKGAADMVIGPVDIRVLAKLILLYDANAVIHGVFIAKSDLAGGRLRLPRLLSGFIEAADASLAESGGVKNDRVNPSGDTKQGFGNVPFHRTEFVAREITGYFNLDLALLRGYRLPEEAVKLLIALSLFKVRRFLSTGLRLRTACDLEMIGDLSVTRPKDFIIPGDDELLKECTRLITSCKEHFADPAITEVEWKPKKDTNAKLQVVPDESEAEDQGDGQ